MVWTFWSLCDGFLVLQVWRSSCLLLGVYGCRNFPARRRDFPFGRGRFDFSVSPPGVLSRRYAFLPRSHSPVSCPSPLCDCLCPSPPEFAFPRGVGVASPPVFFERYFCHLHQVPSRKESFQVSFCSILFLPRDFLPVFISPFFSFQVSASFWFLF